MKLGLPWVGVARSSPCFKISCLALLVLLCCIRKCSQGPRIGVWILLEGCHPASHRVTGPPPQPVVSGGNPQVKLSAPTGPGMGMRVGRPDLGAGRIQGGGPHRCRAGSHGGPQATHPHGWLSQPFPSPQLRPAWGDCRQSRPSPLCGPCSQGLSSQLFVPSYFMPCSDGEHFLLIGTGRSTGSQPGQESRWGRVRVLGRRACLTFLCPSVRPQRPFRVREAAWFFQVGERKM